MADRTRSSSPESRRFPGKKEVTQETAERADIREQEISKEFIPTYKDGVVIGEAILDEGTTSPILTYDAPPAPTNLAAVTGASENIVYFDVSWDAPTDEGSELVQSYELQYKLDSASEWVTVRTKLTSTRVQPVETLQDYDFRVRSVSWAGVSGDWTSEETEAAGADATIPAQVTGLTISVGLRTILAVWNANSEADLDRYRIQVSTVSNFATTVHDNFVYANIVGIGDLDPNTQYYVRVAALDRSANQGTYSSTANGTTAQAGSNDLQADSVIAAKIAANAVTTAKLDADSVTAAKLAAVAIETGKYISSTTYTAGSAGWKINADGSAEFNNVTVRGLLLASQVTVTDAVEILTNGTIDTDTTGWAGSNATLAQETTKKRTGAGSLKLTASSAADMYAYTPEGSSGYAVTPGATYVARFWSRAESVIRYVSARIRWYDSGGTFISQAQGVEYYNDLTTWQGVSVSGIAPSNAAYASVRTFVASPANTEVHYVDDISLFRSSDVLANLRTRSVGPRIELDGSWSYWHVGRDGETRGTIRVGQNGSGASDRPFIGIRPPVFSGATPAIDIIAERVSDPSVGPPQINYVADAHSFFEANSNKLQLHANVGAGGPKPLCPLLSEAVLRDGSQTVITVSTTSAAGADLDATNLACTFIAPKSGKVVVEASLYGVSPANAVISVLLREGSSAVPNSEQRVLGASGTAALAARVPYQWEATGLTPGTSYTWKLAAYRVTANCSIGHGPQYGPINMQVWGVLE